MPLPEGSRGERDASPMPLSEGSRGERDASRSTKPTRQQRLYLIFDDWEWGYSIYKLKLPPRPTHQPRLRPLEQRSLRRLEPRRPQHKRLPPPCICLEAPRGSPMLFAAVGTHIIGAHHRYDMGDAPVAEQILPILDVCSLGIRFGPGLLYPLNPIFITVGDEELFALDMHNSFWMLSMEPLCSRSCLEWSWCDLPDAPLSSMEATSFAVDGRTIFFSTDRATFAFDIDNSKWGTSSNCSLPFKGLANYVHALDIFVGFSKDLDTYGHLSFCRKLCGDENVKLSKENLLSKDPAESLVGATLVYLGGSEPGFCLVECVKSLVKCVDEGGGNERESDQPKRLVVEPKRFGDEGASVIIQECGELDGPKKFVDKGDGASGSMHDRYFYRLTTFSVSFDNNGDLTTGETRVVQCYKAPEEVSERFYHVNPVAFWL